MIDSILGYSLDYALACYGLLMFIASVEMYRMRRRDVLWQPWKWLSAYAGLQVVHSWSVLASISLPLDDVYYFTGFIILSLSYFCLFEFGVRSMIGKRGATWRVVSAPLVLVALIVAVPSTGLNIIVVLFALVSSITSAFAMLRHSDQRYRENRALLCFGAVSLLMCGVTMSIGMMNAYGLQLNKVSSSAFIPHHTIPIEYYQLLAAGLFFLFVMLYAMSCNKNDGRRLGHDKVTPYHIYITVALIPLLSIGWVLCKMGGDFGIHQFRKSLLGRAQTAAANISPGEVEKLYHLDRPGYPKVLRFFREQMDQVRRVNGDTRFIYLLGKVGQNIVFLADCEQELSPDYSPPMQIYTEANQPVRDAFKKPDPAFDGPTEDRWGVYVSAFVPIVSKSTGEVVAVMGMDITGNLWLSAVARYRLAAIIVMLIVVIVLVVLGSAYILVKDALANSAMSQSRFQRVFDAAPEGILIVSTADGLVRAANQRLLLWLSMTFNDIAGQPMSMYLPTDHELPESGYEFQINDSGNIRYLGVTSAEINFRGYASHLYFLRDITQQRQAVEAKEALVTELQETNLELQQIIHAVAHDLKAPTRSISTLTQWIKSDYQPYFDEPANRMLNTIIDRTHRMDRLLSGLLEFMRIGRIRPTYQPVNFRNLVDDAVKQCHANDRCHVEVNVPETVITDASLMTIILVELIENAVSHGFASGRPVVVSASLVDDILTLHVKDYGPGIDPKYHMKVFELFQTLSPKDETGRLGLGLALVNKVVHRLGGRISLDSTPGEGCVVSISVAAV
ncbi:MAG: sensor histidine kinase [Armatimonadota bacterium]